MSWAGGGGSSEQVLHYVGTPAATGSQGHQTLVAEAQGCCYWGKLGWQLLQRRFHMQWLQSGTPLHLRPEKMFYSICPPLCMLQVEPLDGWAPSSHLSFEGRRLARGMCKVLA